MQRFVSGQNVFADEPPGFPDAERHGAIREITMFKSGDVSLENIHQRQYLHLRKLFAAAEGGRVDTVDADYPRHIDGVFAWPYPAKEEHTALGQRQEVPILFKSIRAGIRKRGEIRRVMPKS